MGTSTNNLTTPGPQQDPSAERNAVSRKTKVIWILVDYKVPVGILGSVRSNFL